MALLSAELGSSRQRRRDQQTGRQANSKVGNYTSKQRRGKQFMELGGKHVGSLVIRGAVMHAL